MNERKDAYTTSRASGFVVIPVYAIVVIVVVVIASSSSSCTYSLACLCVSFQDVI